ncbi:hypothetical protein GCM10010294_20050 [Streptomyces griseoloalbus]|nr:hypothetical protein GCM10010294_20050 [Streptomyces griseoloalbus]
MRAGGSIDRIQQCGDGRLLIRVQAVQILLDDGTQDVGYVSGRKGFDRQRNETLTPGDNGGPLLASPPTEERRRDTAADANPSRQKPTAPELVSAMGFFRSAGQRKG